MLDTMLKLWIGAQHRLEGAMAHLRRDEEGQTLVEYALLLVLIAIVVIVVLTLLGSNVNNVYNKIAQTVNAV